MRVNDLQTDFYYWLPFIRNLMFLLWLGLFTKYNVLSQDISFDLQSKFKLSLPNRFVLLFSLLFTLSCSITLHSRASERNWTSKLWFRSHYYNRKKCISLVGSILRCLNMKIFYHMNYHLRLIVISLSACRFASFIGNNIGRRNAVEWWIKLNK